MQQSCTYGSVRGALGQPASLPRQRKSQFLGGRQVCGGTPMVDNVIATSALRIVRGACAL